MRETILEIAKHSINKAVLEDEEWLPDLDEEVFSGMRERQGVFTSLYTADDETNERKLRGCIGLPYPIEPLAHAVAISSMKSAIKDPRFPPVAGFEIDELIIEVEVLSPIEKIEFKDTKNLESQIKIGTHGLVVKYLGFSGLLLPKVASRYSWTPRELIEKTIRKAGLPENVLEKDGIEFYRFTSELYY